MLVETAPTNGNGAVLCARESLSAIGPIVPSETTALCEALQELQVRRKFWIGIANKQTNATGALVRRNLGFVGDQDEATREKLKKRAARVVARALGGKPQEAEDGDVARVLADDFLVMQASLAPAVARRHDIELQMKRVVRKLPVYEWAKGVRGLGEIGLGVIVGEAGDLSKYATKRKLWRRLGLGMAPGHEAHAYSTWRMKGGLMAEDWTAAGYAPRRRAEIHACVAEPMFRQQTMVTGPYRQAYDKRRAHCEVTHSDWTKGHLHADALRIMTKKLISDLWSEWRKSLLAVAENRSSGTVASASLIAAE